MASNIGSGLCPNWVFSSASDVHIAKDREWFGDDYKPFNTFTTTMTGTGPEAIGVGTVELPTKTGPSCNGIIRLENVLHTPTALCNILGGPMLRDYDVVMRYEPWGSFCTIVDLRSSQLVAYFKPHHESNPLKEVLLSDPPIGPLVGHSVFEPGVEYNIHVFWPMEERGRFERTGSLTLAQGAWLKKHFGNENKFLRTYNLNIDKDEDRAEGRAIVRSMMRHGGGE